MFNAPGDDGAWTQLLRRVALAHGETELLTEIVARYRLRDGSRALIDAIAAECSADIRLSTAVSAVTSSDTAAAVQTEAGTVRARAAIVTAPLHAVRAITFEPSLAGAQQALIDEGQMTRGAMLWVLASGISEPTVAYAAGEVVSYAKWDGELDDKSLLNVFVPDVKAIDLNSLEAIQAGLELLLPEVQVHDVLFHNWVRDTFSRQTWTMLRPGQLTRSSVTCRPTDSRVFFAGSDYASGWLGFIDGAIESALRTTRQVRGLLGNERSA
jgi:monoamine oxidase